MIKAEIVCDSIAPSGVRLTTYVLTYPRFIHAELMTHRMLSRNASSSRAIPLERMIKDIENECARPIEFRENCKGMQAGDALGSDDSEEAYRTWESAMRDAVYHARKLSRLNVHKQYVNRLLEPFAHITVVVTATEWDNFFALRYHKMAQPEFQQLAKVMWDARCLSIPELLKAGQWHLPFVTKSEKLRYDEESQLQMSVARCARTSYLNHDGGQTTLEQDIVLFNRLLGSQPIHASPAEHQGWAVSDPELISGNFKGWIQYRKTLQNENITKFEAP